MNKMQKKKRNLNEIFVKFDMYFKLIIVKTYFYFKSCLGEFVEYENYLSDSFFVAGLEHNFNSYLFDSPVALGSPWIAAV